jgi:hypothetical protein
LTTYPKMNIIWESNIMLINDFFKTLKENDTVSYWITVNGEPITKYENVFMAKQDLEIVQKKFPDKDIKIKVEKRKVSELDRVQENFKPKLIKKHYFSVYDDQTAVEFGLQKDSNGDWYLPQYTTSGAGFDRKFTLSRRTFGDSYKTITINESKKSIKAQHDSEDFEDSQKHQTKKSDKKVEKDQEITDPEVLTVRQFAKSHYAGAKSEQEAFDKFVIHGLRHSEDNDNVQNEKLKDHQRQLQDLNSKINQLLSQTNSNNIEIPKIDKISAPVAISKEKQVPVSEEIQQVMKNCIDLLFEKHSKIHKNSVRALPASKNYPEMNSFYDLYRFGVDMAGQPNQNAPSRGPFGQSPATYAYSQGDEDKVKATEKSLKKRGKYISKGRSREAPDTYVVSPVPTRNTKESK